MSDLEITRVDAHLVDGPRPWLLVRIETDGGVTGVGEILRTRHQPADVERLGRELIGADPFETERLFGAGGALEAARNGLFTTTITGGLDMACWDVKGNAAASRSTNCSAAESGTTYGRTRTAGTSGPARSSTPGDLRGELPPRLGDGLLVDSLSIADGRLEVPDRPGLGVELDEDLLREYEIARSSTT